MNHSILLNIIETCPISPTDCVDDSRWGCNGLYRGSLTSTPAVSAWWDKASVIHRQYSKTFNPPLFYLKWVIKSMVRKKNYPRIWKIYEFVWDYLILLTVDEGSPFQWSLMRQAPSMSESWNGYAVCALYHRPERRSFTAQDW